MRLDAVDAKKHWTRKALDMQVKAKRSAILLGTKVLFKLLGVTFERFIGRNLGEFVKLVKSKTYGATKYGKEVEKGSTFEKGADFAALREYNKTLATQTIKAMREVFTKGGSESDALFKSDELHGFKKIFEKGGSLKDIVNAVGEDYSKLAKSLHGAEKAPLALAEETYAKERLMNNLRRETGNKNLQFSDLSEKEQWQLKERAWREGNEAKLMNENFLSKGWTRMTDRTGKMGFAEYALKSEAKVLVPIVKVPINLVLEGLDYSFGLVRGLSQTITHGINGTLGDLTYEQKQQINKSISRGSLGAAISLYATLNPSQFVDDKGEFNRLFGVHLPKGVIKIIEHHPIFLGMKIASETSYYFNKAREKSDVIGEAAAAFRGTASGLEDIPFLNVINQIKYVKTPAKAFETAANIAIGSTIVPQFVREAAMTMDMSEEDKKEISNYLKNYFTEDKTIKREPDISGDIPNMLKGVFWQGMIEQNVPYLRQNIPTKSESAFKKEVIEEAVNEKVEELKSPKTSDAEDKQNRIKEVLKKNNDSKQYKTSKGDIINIDEKISDRDLEKVEDDLMTENEKKRAEIIKENQELIDQKVKDKL